MSVLTDEQIADGWIEHDGGPCPMPDEDIVEVLFADHTTDMTYAAFWSAALPGMDDSWTGECASDDRIIAYRPAP